jgi:hypothetical protein
MTTLPPSVSRLPRQCGSLTSHNHGDSFTLLSVCDNAVLEGIFRPKNNEVKGGSINLHNEI